jgi:hypothetical protein
MKFKLLCEQTHDWTGRPTPGAWKQAVSYHVEAADVNAALVIFQRQILWLTPEMKLRCEPATGPNLGAQLWEPCQRCGQEPSYAQANGHFCATCAAKHDHPRISTRAQHSVEPEERHETD